MSKGSNKKKKRKNNSVNKTTINKNKYYSTRAEKLEYFIYIFQYVLFICGIIGGVTGLFCLIVSRIYELSQYYETSIVTVILSFIILFNYFTFGKFKEVRKKYGKSKKGDKK